jgi:DnaJ-class molecular chaperone
MAQDFYAVLALPRSATEEQIRSRFRELARTRHPDRFQGAAKERAEQEFQEVTRAFNVLIDPERRRKHDLELARPDEPATQAVDPRQVARAYLQRGAQAYKEKSFVEAADHFERAAEADPKSALAWHHLAQASSHSPSRLPRAVAAIEKACELEPMNTSYLKQAGRICRLAGRNERALQFYRRAIQWGEDDPAVHRALEELSRSPRRGLFGSAT